MVGQQGWQPEMLCQEYTNKTAQYPEYVSNTDFINHIYIQIGRKLWWLHGFI